MNGKLSFGVEPNMREVPPGQYALIKIGKFAEWSNDKETEWGEKYSFPITLLDHPDYPSIPKKGLEMNWVSRCVAAEKLYQYIYDEKGEIRTFDFDVEALFKGNYKLHRTEAGTYQLEQL